MHQALRKYLSPFVNPAVYDFWVQKLRPHAAWDRPLARVVDRRPAARGAVTLELRPNHHFTGFQPGQHINVTVEVDGVRQTRSYSLCDVPRRDRRLVITVRQVEGGRVSGVLCRDLKKGDVVEISQAFGDMTVPADYDGPWLLLAAGSGITPLVSVLRWLTRTPLRQDVTLLYWARTRADLFFHRELCELALREPRFRFVPVLTREATLLPGEAHGRPGPSGLDELVPDIPARRVYACGPAGFVDTVAELVGHRAAHFRSEAFTPRQPEAIPGERVRVRLSRSGRTVEVASGMPLLAALEAAGERPAYGCRMGICNTCACGKLEGLTRNLNSRELGADPDSALKLCINAAQSDLVLDL